MDLMTLYKQANQPNPYNESVQMLGNQMNQMQPDRRGYSAVAKIPMMWAQGAMSGQGDKIEAQRADATNQLVAGQLDQKRASQMMETIDKIVNISKTDPDFANKLISREASLNPDFRELGNVQFTAQTTKDGWMNTINKQTGEQIQIYYPDYMKTLAKGLPPDQAMADMQKRGTLLPVGDKTGHEIKESPVARNLMSEYVNVGNNDPRQQYSAVMEQNKEQAAQAGDAGEVLRINNELATSGQIPDQAQYQGNIESQMMSEPGGADLMKKYVDTNTKENKPEDWQPWGEGQMRNKATGEIRRVPVRPLQPKEPKDPETVAIDKQNKKERLDYQQFRNDMNAFARDYPGTTTLNPNTGQIMILPEHMDAFKKYSAQRGAGSSTLNGKTLIGRDKKTGKNVYQDANGNKFLGN